MSKVKKLKETKWMDSINVEAEHAELAAKVPWTLPPELRYLVKREPTFWKKGIKVLQFHNGVEWLDVPKVRTVK